MPRLFPAQLDARGHLVLFPSETNRGRLDLVDIEFVDGLGGVDGYRSNMYQDGSAIVTNYRLVWIGNDHESVHASSAAWTSKGVACYIPLSAVANCEVSKPKIVMIQFQPPKIKLHLRLDSEGYPSSSSLEYSRLSKVRIIPHRRISVTEVDTWHGQVHMAVQQRAWTSVPDGIKQQMFSKQISRFIVPTNINSVERGGSDTSGDISQGGNVSSHQIDSIVCKLMEMGYTNEQSIEALEATKTKDINEAINWILDVKQSKNANNNIDRDNPTSTESSRQETGIRDSISTVATTSVGVAAILERQERKAAERDRILHEALGDLNKLMSKAEEMVNLAKRFHERARLRNSEENDEEIDDDLAIELADLGISSPVTRESAGRLYFRELSQQLGEFLHSSKVVIDSGGLLPLSEAYRIFCRARFTDIISPDDFLQAAKLLLETGTQFFLQEFPSGTKVITSASHSEDVMIDKVVELAKEGMVLNHFSNHLGINKQVEEHERCPWVAFIGQGISRDSVARTLDVPFATAAELIKAAESRGYLCRDDGPEGVTWYDNFFISISDSSNDNSVQVL